MGEHGKRTAQKSRGLEGALVDASPIQIAALDADDTRSLAINVAGEAALLVAKLHKLGDRLDVPRRLDAKDAGDDYRLFDSLAADAMAGRIRLLLNDDRSARSPRRHCATATPCSDRRRRPASHSASKPSELPCRRQRS